jgi:hypothetical protein
MRQDVSNCEVVVLSQSSDLDRPPGVVLLRDDDQQHRLKPGELDIMAVPIHKRSGIC